MKKSLGLLTLSLIMAIAMIFGVSAVIADSDVGFYVRFDSQNMVDTYAHGMDKAFLSFDGEEGAMRVNVSSTTASSGNFDINTYLNFPANYTLTDYPYLRVTYKVPTVGINGQTVSTDSNYLFCNNGFAPANGGLIQWGGFSWGATDKWERSVFDVNSKKGSVTNIGNIRLDVPNNAYSSKYFEYYVYDFGMFKTAEAAYAYNPGLEYYVYDMTSLTEYENWNTSQSTMTYNAELGATVFTHDKVETSVDARIQMKNELTADKWFPLQNYPVLAWCYQTNLGETFPVYSLDTVKTVNGTTLSTTGLGSGVASSMSGGFPNKVTFEDGWTIGYADLSQKFQSSNFVTLAKHNGDPFNTQSPTTGEEYVAFKYIAYFKNAEDAAKGATFAPAGLGYVQATSADGKATITGVDTTMEYRIGMDGEYTAVTGESIEATPGATYYVRYAATETALASNPTAVTVPNYWNFEITDVKNAKGESVNPVINAQDKNNVTINVPYGTNAKNIALVWNYESSVPATLTPTRSAEKARANPVVYKGGHVYENRAVVTNGAIGDFSAYLAENGDSIQVVQAGGIYEYINIKLIIDEPAMTNEELTQGIVDEFALKEIDNYALLGTNTETEAYNAIYAAAEVAETLLSYPDATADVVITAFTAPIKGSADDIDGTDGIVSYKFVASREEVSAESDVIDIVIPAQHFRVLWKFNDQEFANQWGYAGNNILKYNGEIPVVTENGETFARFQITDKLSTGGIYITYAAQGNPAYKDIYAGAEYNSFLKAEDYPYTMIYYRSDGTFPNTNGGSGHFYFVTSEYIKGDDYSYREPGVNPSDIEVFLKAIAEDPTAYPGGAFKGYSWYKNGGFWSFGANLMAKNTEGQWKAALIDNTGNGESISYASNGYQNVAGTIDYKAGNTFFPWEGDLLEYRYDIQKGTTPESGTMDIMAIAFFSNLEDFNNFDLSTITPLTADEKAAADAIVLEAVDGIFVNSEEAALADATAKVEAALSDYAIDAISVTSAGFTAMDAENGTDGVLTVDIKVVKGKVLGDRDVYTVRKTMNITVPQATLDNAIEAINAVVIDDTASLYTEAQAEAYVLDKIADVIAAFPAYTYAVTDATFVAPVDGETDGSYAFKFTVSDGENSAVTEEISIVNAKANVAPYIINFDNEVILSNAHLPNANLHQLKKTLIDSETALGGKALYLEKVAETLEFNVSFLPGRNGMDYVEELSEYSVIAYRYKLSNGDPTKLLQVYYYTDLYDGGHAYQQVSISQDGADISDKWVTRYFTVKNPGFSASGCSDTTWGSLLEEIRFDFMRPYAGIVNAEIDYIGLFANENQAKAFMANPTKNGSEEALSAYDDIIAEINAYDSDLGTVKSSDINVNGDGELRFDELDAYLTAYIENLNLGVDAYYAVTAYTKPIEGTEETPEAVDGSVTLKVAFADGGVQNGYVATSKEFTIIIDAADYVAPIEGEVVDGVIYGADTETGKATIVGIEDAESVVIPATVTINEVEYAVTAIAADAFAGMTAKEVRLPNTITEAVEITGYEGYVFVQPKTATAAAVTG
ncbi:MAG: hypothetical protein IJO52_00130, partial [Clostridia bacterium]|nr:hypothetical protein [Clostridia bacterium]